MNSYVLYGNNYLKKYLTFYYCRKFIICKNNDGKVTQTLNYLPYGEDWVDLQNFSEMPKENNLGVYQFNGKEKDDETGYNYYGARYYDSEKLGWLSVDPMSDKYPNLSPYVYCADNPVKLIDPDGDSIKATKEAWEIMQNAFESTLGKDNPFNLDANGFVSYTEKNYNYSDAQMEIITHFKNLIEDKSYLVNVNVVDNDQAIPINNYYSKNLYDENANGFIITNIDKTESDVYISRHPFQYDDKGRRRNCAQKEDYQSIISLHEIGGHAYYNKYNQKLSKNDRNRETEKFEEKCRSIFKGKYGSNDIKTGKVKQHDIE